jgi:hypothetical protein
MALDLDVLAPVSEALTMHAVGAAQDMQAGSVAAIVPSVIVPSTKRSGLIWRGASQAMLGNGDTTVLNGFGTYPLGQSTDPATVSYSVVHYASPGRVLPDDIARASQFPMPLAEVFTEEITRHAILALEARVCTALTTSGNWGGDTLANLAASLGLGSAWTTIATATPLSDLQGIIRAATTRSFGRKPTHVVMGRKCADYFGRSLQAAGIRVVTSGAAVGPSIVSDADLKAIVRDRFGVELVIGDLLRNTAAEGVTASNSQVFTESSVWVGHLPSTLGAVIADAGPMFQPTALVVPNRSADLATLAGSLGPV